MQPQRKIHREFSFHPPARTRRVHVEFFAHIKMHKSARERLQSQNSHTCMPKHVELCQVHVEFLARSKSRESPRGALSEHSCRTCAPKSVELVEFVVKSRKVAWVARFFDKSIMTPDALWPQHRKPRATPCYPYATPMLPPCYPE